MKIIILDTNKLFSSLLARHSAIREKIFAQEDLKFYTCKFCMVELFKHKEKLLRCSALNENELLEVFYKLLKRINIYDEDAISPLNWKAAIDLCSDIDEKDSVFIALTLHLQGILWTGDKKLVNGLKAKGFDLFFE